MNRLHAILLGLMIAACAPYSHAGVMTLTAAQPGWTVEGEAITPDSPAVAGAGTESTEGYQPRESTGAGEMPETVAPPDETKGAAPSDESTPGDKGDQVIEQRQPSDTGNMPESVGPPDESGGSDSPSDSRPGSSY